ncbi:hypothetical protein C8J57DRAFT_1718427 [Mycena rebaudengoi]|nr:hypothetical protein C8J57DRAFT_1718427 [Mycena rebaudengoi]
MEIPVRLRYETRRVRVRYGTGSRLCSSSAMWRVGRWRWIRRVTNDSFPHPLSRYRLHLLCLRETRGSSLACGAASCCSQACAPPATRLPLPFDDVGRDGRVSRMAPACGSPHASPLSRRARLLPRCASLLSLVVRGCCEPAVL